MFKNGNSCLYNSFLFDLWLLIQFKSVNIVNACVHLSFELHKSYSNVMLPNYQPIPALYETWVSLQSSQDLDCFLSHRNWVHISKPRFLELLFNITTLSKSRSPRRTLSFMFRDQMSLWFFTPPILAACLVHLILLCLIILLTCPFSEELKLFTTYYNILESGYKMKLYTET